jgi:hypothetical protein
MGSTEFSLTLYRTNLSAIRGSRAPHQVEITIDGARVFLGHVGGEAETGRLWQHHGSRPTRSTRGCRCSVPVQAGPRVVGAAFVRKIGAGSTRLQPFLRSSAGTYDSTGRPHIETLTITGPFEQTGPGDTPSRRPCLHLPPRDGRRRDGLRGRDSFDAGAARAAARRRPAELDRLLDFYRAGTRRAASSAGADGAAPAAREPVVRVPRRGVGAGGSGATARVTDLDLELAPLVLPLEQHSRTTRCSSWRCEGAERPGGARGTDAAHARRLRRRRRSPQLRRAVAARPEPAEHRAEPRRVPGFRRYAARGVSARDGAVLRQHRREDRSVIELLTADYTFVNERLAKHYGLPHIYGSHFRRVTLADDAGDGILGKGSLLMVTSHADRTAPVLRGKWILENVLGTPPPPPPADVPPLEESEGASPRPARAARTAPRQSGLRRAATR